MIHFQDRESFVRNHVFLFRKAVDADFLGVPQHGVMSDETQQCEKDELGPRQDGQHTQYF